MRLVTQDDVLTAVRPWELGAEATAPKTAPSGKMNANGDTPREGENVSVESVSKRDARQRFLQSNLQLIADRLHHVRSGVGEREPGDLRRELQEVRAEVAAVEEMLPTRTLDELGELTEWRCRYCGNVMLRKGRPTRCLQCRRGEHENGKEALTERVER